MIRIRKADWETCLYSYCDKKRSAKFKYGSHDCVKFSAGAVKAMTGLNVLSGIVNYKSLKQGKAILDAAGGLFNATQACLKEYPIAEVKVGEAVTGDVIGFLNDNQEEQIGIMYDLGSIVSVGKSGVVWTTAHGVIKRCWSV